ncbi:MAG TPA: Rieske 2Fe-2S domain-containing protein [Chloroflexota bacterium]|nr:Rieske 2Fe-2S domain-containing protein [Chloroflexota bacterium]
MPFNNRDEEDLVRVGPGTPSGEVFRRYWLPVECSANLGGGGGGNVYRGANNPLKLTVLGEHLVLFRDGHGKPGLLAEHCSHRGTSLSYGCVEAEGIRCLYHGWLYDTEGHCLETPAEPPDSSFKLTVRQTAYPCVEVAGLIFAYMGPPDKQPNFPRYHQLFAEHGVRVVGNGGYIEQCNVFQAMHDNNLDPWHGEIAHGWYRGGPRPVTMHHGRDGEPATPLKFERTPWGTRMVMVKSTKTPGRYWYHETHTVWPTQRCNFTDARSMKWAVPVDDYRTRWFTVDFFPLDPNGNPPPEALAAQNQRFNIGHVENLPLDWAQQVGAWWNLGHPWRQGNLWEDEVAQQTQGPEERHFLPDWEKWRLATSDRGLLLNREVWREQVERVRQGLDPIGVTRGQETDELIRITSDDKHGLTWEEGMRLFNLSVEERMAMVGAGAVAGRV